MQSQKEFVETVEVRRWPTEKPLFVAVLLSAIALWLLLAVSIIGFIYAAMIGVFFFVSHVAFITHLRGSAVRLGPEQMPDLYARVQQLSRRIGLTKTPEAYVMQAGGSLNALATKLFSANFIVLYSDLLEACGDNTEARDMIIAHELGHLQAGHLRGMWFLLPGLLVPFLGSAYSRAREYTADRYGFATCHDKKAAQVGLGILAAGGAHGPNVNLRAFANQGNDLNTMWMTLGRWLVSHPPLVDRIVAVEPTLITNKESRLGGAIAASTLIISLVLLPSVAAVVFGTKIMGNISQGQTSTQAMSEADQVEQPPVEPGDVALTTQQAWRDMEAFSAAIEEYRLTTGVLPVNADAAYAAWNIIQPESQPPVDPFDGYNYGYDTDGDSYIIWSEGPSPDKRDDDIVFTPPARP